MSEVRLVLRDTERDLFGTCHGSIAERVVAALSSEPETLDELEVAFCRFEQPDNPGWLAWFRSVINDEPYDAGLVVIDLAARLIACDSTYASFGRRGSVFYHDGHSATEHSVRYHLPDDWQITSEAWNWRPIADARRRVRIATSAMDARAVLYRLPLVEFIATECFQAFHSEPGGAPAAFAPADAMDDANWRSFDDDSPPRSEYERGAIREIHARWLRTSRPDLRNQAPRDLLLGKRGFIDRDLEDRAAQWSTQGRCPPGLNPQSHAYRFAGFGTHEIVIYYYLVRRLLWSCREQVATIGSGPRSAMMAVGDFLTTEVTRLGQFRDLWLDAPDPEYHGRTPRSIIDRERQRLPEGVSPEESIIDHDCPLCQMMADGLSGPMFWHLDGCNMDPGFDFSFHANYEDWEAEQREYEAFSRQFEERQAERERLGVKYPGEGYSDPDYVWQRSFVAEECDGIPLELRLFGIGSNLAELIVDLKQPDDNRPLIDQLSRDFGNLRALVHADDPSQVEALAEPVIERFCETLADVASVRYELQAKCEDLSQRVRRFFEAPVEGDRHERSDDDIPF